MANSVDKVLAVALAEEGYLEKSAAAYQRDNSVLYLKTEGAGADNYTKYGYEMHLVYPSVMDFPSPYCDAFVDWCFYKAYGVATAKSLLGGNFDDYTVASAQMYKNKKAYYKSNPQVGDQIFFNNGTRIYHTGLVIAVDDTTVYTIEGNTNAGNTVVENGGGVAKKSYSLNYEKIDGYGRPKYEPAEELKDGWRHEKNGWYYYKDGKKLIKYWLKDKGYWYRLGNDGKMLTGWHQIYDKDNVLSWCYFDDQGRLWHERADHQGYLEVWLDQ